MFCDQIKLFSFVIVSFFSNKKKLQEERVEFHRKEKEEDARWDKLLRDSQEEKKRMAKEITDQENNDVQRILQIQDEACQQRLGLHSSNFNTFCNNDNSYTVLFMSACLIVWTHFQAQCCIKW